MALEDPYVLTAREGVAGIVLLNRPKAMNALTLPMIRLMRQAIDGFLEDPAVGLVMIGAVEGRAFCAGGDIRACAVSGRAGDGIAEAFWREEYELIWCLAEAAKPVVALMDGVVMGGGAGLAMHLLHRVVTENVRFAMPEVGIGFLPDVGASYLLPRLENAFGRYLALTGQSVGPGDMLVAGLADGAVSAADLPGLRHALASMPLSGVSQADVAALIESHAGSIPSGVFARHCDLIRRAFAEPDVRGILEVLAAVAPDDRDAAFAAATAVAISGASPYSLALTMELLRRGASDTLEACLVREYRAASFCLTVPDFHEGVRATVIDKDRRPTWPSAAPDAVLPDIETILAPRPGHPDPALAGAA